MCYVNKNYFKKKIKTDQTWDCTQHLCLRPKCHQISDNSSSCTTLTEHLENQEGRLFRPTYKINRWGGSRHFRKGKGPEKWHLKYWFHRS